MERLSLEHFQIIPLHLEEIKKFESFLKALLNYIAKNVIFAVLAQLEPCMLCYYWWCFGSLWLVVRRHGFDPRILCQGSSWSHPWHDGEIELSIPRPRASNACYVMPTIDLADEFTAFIVPLSLVALSPRHLASFLDMKLWVVLVCSKAQVPWPLIVAFMYISHFFTGAGGWLLNTPRH